MPELAAGQLPEGAGIPKPLGNRVIVRPQKSEQVTKTGIVLVSEEKDTQVGEVLAVGPGSLEGMSLKLVEPPVEVGDTVLYAAYGATKFTKGDEELLIFKSDDILAVL